MTHCSDGLCILETRTSISLHHHVTTSKSAVPFAGCEPMGIESVTSDFADDRANRTLDNAFLCFSLVTNGPVWLCVLKTRILIFVTLTLLE
ncbi:hypothetical protein ACTXT7_000728 [Hymenolepis weldensis]